jgi:hypothetical protein
VTKGRKCAVQNGDGTHARTEAIDDERPTRCRRLAESHPRIHARMQPRLKCGAMMGPALCLVAQATLANIFVEDRREQRDAEQPILRSVGMLHHAAAGVGGTAFLVSRCHVATAFHVAFVGTPKPGTSAVEYRPGIGRTAEFLIGPDAVQGSRFAAKTRATVVAFGRFSPADFRDMAGDWAILRLDACLGKKYGHLKYARPGKDDTLPAGALMAIGFPRSHASRPGISVEVGCKARDHGPVAGLVGIDCAFESGMSGGPVLECQADGSWLVVGLIQQSMAPVDGVLPGYSMQHRNQMLSVSAFWKGLDNVLRADSRKVLSTAAR